MRRFILSAGGLLVAASLIAQQQGEQQEDGQAQQQSASALEQAPSAVREKVMRQVGTGELQRLSRVQHQGRNIYEAVVQGERTETTLHLTENGRPLSMRIAGLGGTVTEAAGADSRQPNQQTQQAQQASPSEQQASDSTITEPAGAKRDEPLPKNEEEKEIQQLRATQDPGETQGVPDPVRKRIQEQLGDAAVEEIQPKVFYQLNVRQNGELQQVWADEKGTLLKPQQ